jgi:hypothetical protein
MTPIMTLLGRTSKIRLLTPACDHDLGETQGVSAKRSSVLLSRFSVASFVGIITTLRGHYR